MYNQNNFQTLTSGGTWNQVDHSQRIAQLTNALTTISAEYRMLSVYAPTQIVPQYGQPANVVIQQKQTEHMDTQNELNRLKQEVQLQAQQRAGGVIYNNNAPKTALGNINYVDPINTMTAQNTGLFGQSLLSQSNGTSISGFNTTSTQLTKKDGSPSFMEGMAQLDNTPPVQYEDTSKKPTLTASEIGEKMFENKDFKTDVKTNGERELSLVTKKEEEPLVSTDITSVVKACDLNMLNSESNEIVITDVFLEKPIIIAGQDIPIIKKRLEEIIDVNKYEDTGMCEVTSKSLDRFLTSYINMLGDGMFKVDSFKEDQSGLLEDPDGLDAFEILQTKLREMLVDDQLWTKEDTSYQLLNLYFKTKCFNVVMVKLHMMYYLT